MADETKRNNYPKSLVKYYKCDKNSLSVLKEMKIWASNPLDFNDPFDCAVQFWKLDNLPRFYLINFLNELDPEKDHNNLSNPFLRDKYFQNFLQLFGVFCLNEGNEEDIFWGYYSDQKGFSIRFNTKFLNESWKIKPVRVNYRSIEEFCLLRSELTDNGKINKKNVELWLTTKKDKWILENEWRYIFILNEDSENPRKKEFLPESILEIVLGFKFFEKAISEDFYNGISKYTFIEDDAKEKIFPLEILNVIKEQKHYSLTRIALDENYNLVHLPIEILEINNVEVLIKHHYPPDQLKIMNSVSRI